MKSFDFISFQTWTSRADKDYIVQISGKDLMWLKPILITYYLLTAY